MFEKLCDVSVRFAEVSLIWPIRQQNCLRGRPTKCHMKEVTNETHTHANEHTIWACTIYKLSDRSLQPPTYFKAYFLCS